MNPAPPWLASYPPDVAAEAPDSGFASLAALRAHCVAQYGERIAFENLGGRLSYAQVETLSSDFAAWCQTCARLPAGARIALMLPNLLQYPVCLFGAWQAGLTVVPCNPLFTARELREQLRDAQVDAIVVAENFAHVLEQVLPEVPVRHVLVTGIGDLLGFAKGRLIDLALRWQGKIPRWRIAGALSLRQALAAGRAAPFHPPPLGRDDLALLQYTGGTTGTPRAAMLSHGNLLANLDQAHAWLRSRLRPRETIVTALPLYHIFALTANCLMFFKIGGANLLITNPRDFDAFVRTLRRWPLSCITGVSTLYGALLDHPGFRHLDFSQLNIALAGGMTLQKPVAERWQALTGRPLIDAYGLTEASPAVSINRLDIDGHTGSIGLPLPSTEVTIRDEFGHDLSIGEAGELCVRGPQVMRGYWRREDETRAAFTVDGYLRTGDIAYLDAQGALHLVDRRKDIIIVSGFNVYPNEVEAVAMSHPAVREAAAIGVPDVHRGEAVRLFVVPRDERLDTDALIAYCRERLAGYKTPREIIIRPSLPKTPVGKVSRRALRDEPPPRPGPPDRSGCGN